MTEPPPRKRFHMHLSTAIVMMFVAGGLIWANASGLDREYERRMRGSNVFQLPEGPWGWPCRIHYPDFVGAVVDLLVALAILGPAWFLCEWVHRRCVQRVLTETPHGRRFRIHRGTAMMMLIAATGLIWVNTIEYLHSGREYMQCGWPFAMWARQVRRTDALMDEGLWPQSLALNIVIGVILLAALCYACECLRGCAARLPAEKGA